MSALDELLSKIDLAALHELREFARRNLFHIKYGNKIIALSVLAVVIMVFTSSCMYAIMNLRIYGLTLLVIATVLGVVASAYAIYSEFVIMTRLQKLCDRVLLRRAALAYAVMKGKEIDALEYPVSTSYIYSYELIEKLAHGEISDGDYIELIRKWATWRNGKLIELELRKKLPQFMTKLREDIPFLERLLHEIRQGT